MKSITNYTEPCICGNPLNEIRISKIWRIIAWSCPTCGRTLASTTVSDSPVASFYAQKTLLCNSNKLLREEKKLPAKPTRVTFYDDNGKRILWKDIVAKNQRWEKRMGPCLQRKPF